MLGYKNCRKQLACKVNSFKHFGKQSVCIKLELHFPSKFTKNVDQLWYIFKFKNCIFEEWIKYNKQSLLVIIMKALILHSIDFKNYCVFSIKYFHSRKMQTKNYFWWLFNGKLKRKCFETINVRFINKNLVFIIIAIFATFVLHKKF